ALLSPILNCYIYATKAIGTEAGHFSSSDDLRLLEPVARGLTIRLRHVNRVSAFACTSGAGLSARPPAAWIVSCHQYSARSPPVGCVYLVGRMQVRTIPAQ